MKRITLFCLLFIFSLAANAAKYYEGTIVFADGKSRNGWIESTLGTDVIYFKKTEKGDVEKIDATKLSKIVIKVKDEKREFHLLKVYKGWGQKKIGGPMWLKVLEKGVATLYVYQSSLSTASNPMNSAQFLDYYCIRKGESAAKWISAASTMNNNQHFRAKAPLYFADYPQLSQKIKSKEYTWKDINTVVQEYNKWAAKKK